MLDDALSHRLQLDREPPHFEIERGANLSMREWIRQEVEQTGLHPPSSLFDIAVEE